MRAELDVGGLLIDFGTGDQHKYTQGGWNTGWGDTDEDDQGVSFGRIDEKSAELHLLLRSRPREIVVRMRSKLSGQRATLKLGRKKLGTSAVGRKWTLVRFPADELPNDGRVTLTLAFRRGGGRTATAEVDWMWLRTAEDATPPGIVDRVAPIELCGKTRPALVSPTARSYSFYVQPPAKAKLAFAYGAWHAATFTVRAYTGDGEAHELFARTVRFKKWAPAEVDLGQFADRVIRLELSTSSGGPRTGWAEPALVTPEKPAPAAPLAAKRKPAANVVFIVMDTCRADMYPTLDPKSRVQLPHYKAFAAKSTSFENAFDNESWTLPSTATLLSGLYPRTHRVFFVRNALPEEMLILPEYLGEHGFQRFAISANKVVSDKFGFDQGWDTFVNTAYTEREDGKYVYGEAIEWLEANHAKGRFLLYIQSMECHTPYSVDREYSERYHPEPYHGQFGNEFESRELSSINEKELKPTARDAKWIRALYDGEATYQDEQIGRLLSKLEELGLLATTMVVITNDHGEEFGEHGHWGHTWNTYDELLRAPLLLYYPPLFPPGRHIEEIVEQVDLTPTIVDALGLPPMPDVDGESLLPLIRGRGWRQQPGRAIIDYRTWDRMIRVGRWKLTVNEKTGWKSLYDIQADPGETNDLHKTAILAGRYAEVYLGEALGAPQKITLPSRKSKRKPIEPVSKKLDKKTRKELEALGYIDGKKDK